MTGGILAAVAAGLPWTVALTASALAMGAVLGLGLCTLRVSSVPLLRASAAAAILAVRSIPPILWLFLVFGLGGGVDGVGPFAAATIGLALITGAAMAEIGRGALAAIDPGQWEAAAVLNLPARSRLVDVVGPQLLRVALPPAGALAIGLLRDTAIASTIGVGEIAFRAQDASQLTSDGLGAFATAGALYIALSLAIAVAARWAGLRLRATVAR